MVGVEWITFLLVVIPTHVTTELVSLLRSETFGFPFGTSDILRVSGQHSGQYTGRNSGRKHAQYPEQYVHTETTLRAYREAVSTT